MSSNKDNPIFSAMWEAYLKATKLETLHQQDLELLQDTFAAGVSSMINEIKFQGGKIDLDHLIKMTNELERYWIEQNNKKNN
jgi:hypothetical protein